MNLPSKYIIVGIVLLATLLRFINLGAQDMVGDDATYAFRSVGYFDHMVSQLQTTPLQWFEEAPWWVKLSFHDHPPLIFLIHFLFFKVSGSMSTVVARLPDALMGIASVWLVFLIGKRLWSRRVGEIAAFLLAVDPYHLWVSPSDVA